MRRPKRTQAGCACHNLGRVVRLFFGFEIEQNSILGACQTFVLLSGPVVVFFWGGIDEIRAFLSDSIFVFKQSGLNASVNSKHQHSPPGDPRATPGILHSTAAPGPGFIFDDLPRGPGFCISIELRLVQ